MRTRDLRSEAYIFVDAVLAMDISHRKCLSTVVVVKQSVAGGERTLWNGIGDTCLYGTPLLDCRQRQSIVFGLSVKMDGDYGNSRNPILDRWQNTFRVALKYKRKVQAETLEGTTLADITKSFP